MKVKQCELEEVGRSGVAMPFSHYRKGIKSICWLDLPEEAKIGSIIDLKSKEGLFVINAIFDIEVDKGEIKRNWHVGGL